MSQSGYTPIALYSSGTASATPTAGNLVSGELAINYADGKLFYKDSSGVVQTLASKATTSGTFTSITDSGLTSGRVTYATTGGLLTDSANLVWDNTNGNLGIGTSSPAWALDIGGSLANIRVAPSVATNNALTRYVNTGGIGYVGLDNSAAGLTSAYALNIFHSGAYPIVFSTSNTERMRIDSSGNVLVGTTAQYANTGHIVTNNSTATYGLVIRDTGATTGGISFLNNSGTGVGSVTIGSATTSYNVTSDQRLKENIVDAPQGNIDQIKVRSFDWKANGSHQEYGMVAQELLEVAPYAVHQPQNPEEMMAVDYSKLVPMMIKEIQDLKQRIATLENK